MPVRPRFQALTAQAPGLSRRITTPVTIYPAFVPTSPPDPLPKGHPAIGLWDTGATGSVIAPSVVAALGLKPVGAVDVSHAGGTSKSPTYLINLQLPNGLGITGVIATEYQGLDGGFQAIIGMDVITLGDFSISNFGGKTCMSFRYPTMESIDYVQQANRMAFAGVGRNDPCPCGKKQPDGRAMKFKLCCGK
jgi:hypothetical protein